MPMKRTRFFELVQDSVVLTLSAQERRRTMWLGVLPFSLPWMLWWVRTSMSPRYIQLEMNDKRIVQVASFSSLWWRQQQPTWPFSTKCGGGSTRFHSEVYLVVLWMREKFRSGNPDKVPEFGSCPPQSTPVHSSPLQSNPIRSIPKTTTTMTIRTTALPTTATGIATSFVP